MESRGSGGSVSWPTHRSNGRLSGQHSEVFRYCHRRLCRGRQALQSGVVDPSLLDARPTAIARRRQARIRLRSSSSDPSRPRTCRGNRQGDARGEGPSRAGPDERNHGLPGAGASHPRRPSASLFALSRGLSGTGSANGDIASRPIRCPRVDSPRCLISRAQSSSFVPLPKCRFNHKTPELPSHTEGGPSVGRSPHPPWNRVRSSLVNLSLILSPRSKSA